VRVIGNDVEEALDDLLQNQGGFDVVVSAPFARCRTTRWRRRRGSSWERVLSHEDFAKLIDDQLTHHFRVARRAALVPNCQIVLLTPDTSFVSSREEFALALFVKNSLHAFTVTLGVETERLPTVPAVNQVQLTRRARAEEPANEQELEEEMERLVLRGAAVRRAGTEPLGEPLPGADLPRQRGHGVARRGPVAGGATALLTHRAPRRQHVRWSSRRPAPRWRRPWRTAPYARAPRAGAAGRYSG
jgi:hypothetical protein